MPPYIPPEITDTIISSVALNPYYHGLRPTRSHTLAMCALVCRTWLPRSRARLFEDICIQDQRTYDLLFERVVRSETMSPYLAFAKSLRFHYDEEDRLSLAARLFFVEFAGKLPELRTLEFWNIDLTHQRPSVKWPLLLSQFHSITCLTLWDCQFSSFHDVRRLLTALPLLSTFHIWRLTCPMVSQEMHLQKTPGPRTFWPELQVLYIDDAKNLSRQCMGMFFKWMTVALRGSAVKVLDCMFALPSTASLRETVLAFVGRVWSSVTDLTIQMSDGLPLSGFVALERLSFDLERYQGNWEGVASVLQDVSSRTIRGIMTFGYVATRKSHFNRRTSARNDANCFVFVHDTLEELDRVLSRGPFGSLKKEVVFDVNVLGHEDSEEKLQVHAHTRRCLPKLHKRKILSLYISGQLQRLDVD
ncbi:hypothetical protein L226DRAFT_205774 [Lentinus tigrinus ALCF2SS1-7]|uniref:F-box domain-containing protein n=1 Tax=Lentinus tigrinus ALCF2SS1-6 TaxID=1328759 RepID=A0A5C2RX39_9APHY|nr:hypothetical protein L227DRAFT_307493 [Lentinus tigrinus ALCF2SS1-6]RPD71278.1 hypothetical protein L226DRAFT_205774 [Lentinus tigrinus ALCF2SS1-7]